MDKIGIICQARLNNTRFPCKLLHPVNGKPVLFHHLEVLKSTGFPVVVAIPGKATNRGLEWLLKKEGYEVYSIEQNEEDVLERFVKCAEYYNFNTIIRTCADSVAITKYEIVDTLRKYHETGSWFAVGWGVHIMSYDALKWSDNNDARIDTRQHVVERLEMSIDYPEDIEMAEWYLNNRVYSKSP